MNGQDYASTPRFPSRQWWLQGAKTLFWVALVTLLVWVYADLEHTAQEEFKVIVRLKADAASDLVLVSDTQGARLSMVNIRLSFELRGNRKMLDRFKRQLSSTGGVLEYEVSGQYGPGVHTIDAAEIVEKAGQLEKQGLTLLSTSRPTVEVVLDRLLTKTVKVRFVATGATLDGEPAIDPPEVDVRVTAGTWEKIVATTSDPRLETESTELGGVPTVDGAATKQVALTANLEGYPVELGPKTGQVTVAFRIAERMGEKELKLSVRVQSPPEWGEKGVWTTHDLERKDEKEWWPTIKVRGPQKDLEKLQGAPKIDPDVDAYITLNDGDKDHPNFWERPIEIRFPSGVNVELVGTWPKVHLKLVERAAAPPIPP